MSFPAAVLSAPEEKLTIEPVDIDEIGHGNVLVRMTAASLCHTDLEVITGQLRYPMPITLGHEGSGVIEAVGPGVDDGRVGQPVVLSWNPHCGSCPACERGEAILCERYLVLGPRGVDFTGQTRLRGANGPIHTMFFTAAFANYAVVTAGCAITVPAELPADRACLLGCGVQTGVGAATRVARIRPGDTALVLGVGAVGLCAVQGARMSGAGTIIAADRHDGKLATAAELGATHTVNVAQTDVLDAVRELTDGRGVDCVIEAAGSAAAFRTSVEACRPGGQVIWLGKLGVHEEISFRWGSLMQEKRIRRVSYGAASPSRDFPVLARQYLTGELKLDQLITNRIRLADINEGFDDLRDGRAIRSVITFD